MMLRLRTPPLACATLFLLSLHGTLLAAPPDFGAARAEALDILKGFIQVDTVSPPGNETRGAQYLKTFLDKAGIPSEILELEPGRGNLVARIKGNGSKRPVLLMGHIDVVGVERSQWTVEPFAGVIKDDYIYGRGAADDKGMASVCLEVFLLLHRLKIPLDRDIIFLAEAGEESTPAVGIDFMVRKHWDKIECEYALNEGGRIMQKDGKVQYIGVATSEKVPRGIFLSAHGVSGHGSRPRVDNAIVHLAAAVAKVGQWQPPMRLNDTTRVFFNRLAGISPPDEALLFRQLEDQSETGPAQEKIRVSYPGYNSMLRTSISPTIIKGGFRNNVIPADALATLDVRFLPDENMEAFAQKIRELINDPAVEVVLAEPGSRKPSAPSKLDTEMFQALERVQTRLFPNAPVLPMMLTGATDSAQLRAKGVQAYGLGNISTDDDSARIHGNDERYSISGMGRLLEYIYWTVIEVAATQGHTP